VVEKSPHHTSKSQFVAAALISFRLMCDPAYDCVDRLAKTSKRMPLYDAEWYDIYRTELTVDENAMLMQTSSENIPRVIQELRAVKRPGVFNSRRMLLDDAFWYYMHREELTVAEHTMLMETRDEDVWRVIQKLRVVIRSNTFQLMLAIVDLPDVPFMLVLKHLN